MALGNFTPAELDALEKARTDYAATGQRKLARLLNGLYMPGTAGHALRFRSLPAIYAALRRHDAKLNAAKSAAGAACLAPVS